MDDRPLVVNADPRSHFDAVRSGSAFRATVDLVRARWPVLAALIVVATLVEMLSFGLVYVDAVGARSLRASIASISIFVAVDPQASHNEVDALGPLLRAIPGIAQASLRSKDEAIKALMAKGVPPPDGRNPLPDVWIVRLDPAETLERGGPGFATAIAEVRRAMSGLPRVDAVTTDESWLATIDALATRWRQNFSRALAFGLATFALSIFSAGFLAGVAVRPSEPSPKIEVPVLALFGVLAGGASLTIAFFACITLVDAMGPGVIDWLQLSALEIARSNSVAISAETIGLFLVLAAAIVLGGHRKE